MANHPCVTYIDIKTFFKEKIDCINTKNYCLVLSTSRYVDVFLSVVMANNWNLLKLIFRRLRRVYFISSIT